MVSKALLLAASGLIGLQCTLAHAAPFMIVGNDEKIVWDDQGRPVLSPPGKDSIVIVDLADPLEPKIVTNIQLKNSADPLQTLRSTPQDQLPLSLIPWMSSKTATLLSRYQITRSM
jgi:hypothetical protein